MISDFSHPSFTSKTALPGADLVARLSIQNTVQNEFRSANTNVGAKADQDDLSVMWPSTRLLSFGSVITLV